MSEILPNLWLGPIDHIHDREFLTENNITHIVTLFEMDIVTQAMVDLHVKQMSIRIHDVDYVPIYDYFMQCCEFIKEGLSACGGVYVHCYAGMSRSPTIVAAYLIKEQGMTADEALKYLREKRPIIDPNNGFRAALLRWENEMQKSY
jgi:protein-tyrosine phosphatase